MIYFALKMGQFYIVHSFIIISQVPTTPGAASKILGHTGLCLNPSAANSNSGISIHLTYLQIPYK